MTVSPDDSEKLALALAHVAESIRICDALGASVPACHLQFGHDLIESALALARADIPSAENAAGNPSFPSA